jgi:hypothetical protein
MHKMAQGSPKPRRAQPPQQAKQQQKRTERPPRSSSHTIMPGAVKLRYKNTPIVWKPLTVSQSNKNNTSLPQKPHEQSPYSKRWPQPYAIHNAKKNYAPLASNLPFVVHGCVVSSKAPAISFTRAARSISPPPNLLAPPQTKAQKATQKTQSSRSSINPSSRSASTVAPQRKNPRVASDGVG